MADGPKLDPTHREGTYRSRVFIGGSYHLGMRSRLEEIKLAVSQAGFHPVIADKFQLENENDTHHETMVLLHSCRLAVFELSELSGALMEIERVPDYGIHALVLFADPNSRGYQVSRMLSTFIAQHSATILLKPYIQPSRAQQHVTEWLKEMKDKEGLG